MRRLLLCAALAACSGETFEVGLCPAPAIEGDGALLGSVESVRMTYSQIEDGVVVGQKVQLDVVTGFVTADVVESGADLHIFAEGFTEPPASADDENRVLLGSTPSPVRTDGIRSVCICMSTPAGWPQDCATPCQYRSGSCSF